MVSTEETVQRGEEQDDEIKEETEMTGPEVEMKNPETRMKNRSEIEMNEGVNDPDIKKNDLAAHHEEIGREINRKEPDPLSGMIAYGVTIKQRTKGPPLKKTDHL